MLKLTERLQRIADYIDAGEKVADIGTDHGYIPVYLKQHEISDYVIAGDINEGPLEKMEENLEKHLGDDREGIIMRLGGGFEVIEAGEVDTAVIAGMGGLLMLDILTQFPEKTCSLNKLILQPRNAQDKLRSGLLDLGFEITDESLIRESRFVWEIIVARPPESLREDFQKESSDEDPVRREYFHGNRVQYEIGQKIIDNSDPLLKEFIEKKLTILRRIVSNASRSDSEAAERQREEASAMIAMLEEILNNVNG